MREFIDRPQQLRNRTIGIIDEVLFFVFVVFFYILFQRDLIAVMQETWSHGQTTNNPLITSLIAIVLLLVVQRIVRAISGLRGRWEALTWLPSFMLLSLSTDVSLPAFSYHLLPWGIIAVAVIGVLLLAVFFSNVTRSDKKTPLSSLLIPNLAIFALSAVLCMEFTNHDAALHQELAAFRYARQGDVTAVTNVGRRSLETTPMLTALRNVALAHEGRLGDELFTYPQPYGSDGLCVNRYSRPDTHFGSQTFYEFLGDEPYGGEASADFCERLYRQDDAPVHRDLYAASLLLDGRLREFVAAFPPSRYVELNDEGGAQTDFSSLPIHYREAWVLARSLYSREPALENYHDAEMQAQFDDFRSRYESAHTDTKIILNELYLTYGKTYWHYFYQTFQNKLR